VRSREELINSEREKEGFPRKFLRLLICWDWPVIRHKLRAQLDFLGKHEMRKKVAEDWYLFVQTANL